MSKGVYRTTEEFEEKLSEYTGAPYVVTIDNACNALFLCLYYEKNIAKTLKTDTITIPARTYPGVPPEIIRNNLFVKFHPPTEKTLKGPYQLEGSNVWDSALRFTHNMYIPGSFMCISMTGGLKTFKMGSKAGAILTDNANAAAWFKRARFSGRREIPYMEDNLDFLGWNYYLNPELALRGLILMNGFYKNGKPIQNEDVELPYPDLSKFPIYSQKVDPSKNLTELCEQIKDIGQIKQRSLETKINYVWPENTYYTTKDVEGILERYRTYALSHGLFPEQLEKFKNIK